MNYVLIIALVGCIALAGADAYQAVTGRRLSKRPSRRTDEVMRRQSAIAAAVLAGLGLVLVGLLIVRMSQGI
jgi:hypothetical protein